MKGASGADSSPCVRKPLLSWQLYNFLGYLMDNFTPSSNEREPESPPRGVRRADRSPVKRFGCHLAGNLISHIFRENEVCRDAEWERYFCYKNIEVPDIYSGPRLRFPLTAEQAVCLLEAFRNKKVRFQPLCLHSATGGATARTCG